MIKTVTIYKNFFINHDYFYKFLQVCGKKMGAGTGAGAGAGAAIQNLGSDSGRQFNFGSSDLGSGFGSATLLKSLNFGSGFSLSPVTVPTCNNSKRASPDLLEKI